LRGFFDLAEDENAVMVFVLVGVVLLILSFLAGVLFARIQLDAQREISDTADLKEVDGEFEKIKRELESAAWESGLKAVEKVREDVSKSGDGYTLAELQSKVGTNTTRIFENYFRENHEGISQVGGYEASFHLRPIPDGCPDIEMIPLYIREQRGEELRWEEIPGFFRVSRTVHVDLRNEITDTFSSRKMTISRTVETNFFLMAERMENFRLERIRKSVDLMSSAYLHAKIFDSSGLSEFEVEGDWFEVSFEDHFNTNWLEEYDGVSGGFGSHYVDTREDQGDIFLGYERDIGPVSAHELIDEDEIQAIVELALLLEQARVFRSYDEELLDRTADSFGVEQDTLLGYLGDGVENKVNLEALIIRLFQDRGTLSKDMFYPGPFLNRTLEGDLLSIIDDNEDWVNTTFGMMKRLFEGELLGEGNRWEFQDLSENVTHPSDISAEKSYLRTLISLYSNNVDVIFESFKVDELEVKEYVEDEIQNLGPLPWMENKKMIGPEGVDKITASILHTAKNLSVSLGFQDSSSTEGATPFYYTFFLSDWGFDEPFEGKLDTEKRLNTYNMQRVIEGKISNEIETRKDTFEDKAESEFEMIQDLVKNYNRTLKEGGKEDHPGWREVWDDLNSTLEVVKNLSSNELFEEGEEGNITSVLDENYSLLKKLEGDIDGEISEWNSDIEDHTRNIIQIQKNFTKNEWTYEVYSYLDDELDEKSGKEVLGLIDDFLKAPSCELTERFDWTLENYYVHEDITIPPEDPKESVGHATLGNFTEHLKRDFLLPLDYSNLYDLFRRININLFDLSSPRDGEEEESLSRLWSILLGRGDPFSEHLSGIESVMDSLVIEDDDIHSDQLSEIDTWFIEDSFTRSIEKLEGVKEELREKSHELLKEDLDENAYEGYADASFYRTAEMFLENMINDMEGHVASIVEKQKRSGYLFENGGEIRSLPVCALPLGGLTVWNNRSIEYGSSFTLELEVHLESEHDLIDIQERSETTIREYLGEVNSTKEWVNPFSKEYKDHYRTNIFVEFNTSEMDLRLKTGDSKLFTFEKYSSEEVRRTYSAGNHRGVMEVLTPMPLLDRDYKPSSLVDHEIRGASFERNVFNVSENRVELSLDIWVSDDEQTFTVEVLKEGRGRRVVPNQWGRYNHYSNLREEDENPVILFSESVEVKGGTHEDTELSFELDTDKFFKEEYKEKHLIIRVKPDIVMNRMQDEQALEQKYSESFSSHVPSFTSTEQVFLVSDKEAYIGVFRMDNEAKGEFDLVTGLPENSWVIEKDGIPFMIDLEEVMEYSKIISGRYGPASTLEKANIPVEAVVDAGASETKITRLPESWYRLVLEDPFSLVFMGAHGEKNHLYPTRVLPSLEGKELNEDMWRSFQKSAESKGSLIGNEAYISLPSLFHTTGARYMEGDEIMKDPGAGTSGYFYYDLESHNSPGRIEQTYRAVEDLGEILAKLEVTRDKITAPYGMGEKSDVLRETGLFEEFLRTDPTKREELFLAACRARDEMGRVEELKDRYPAFSKGSIALSLDILGEDLTEQALSWFEEEDYNEPVKELRAFLSFDGTFLKELPEKLGEGDMSYKEAIGELSEQIDMDFMDARSWGVEDLDDVHSLDHLLDNFKKDSISTSVSHGLRPSALDRSEYEIDIDEFSKDLDELSSSRYFVEFVQEMNSGNYENLPSFYFAARVEDSEVTWMPFGDKGAPLLIEDRIGYYYMSMAENVSGDELRQFINHTITDSIQDMEESKDGYAHRERALIIIDGRFELEDEQKIELKRHIKKVTESHCPHHHIVGAVELRSEGEHELRYVHL